MRGEGRPLPRRAPHSPPAIGRGGIWGNKHPIPKSNPFETCQDLASQKSVRDRPGNGASSPGWPVSRTREGRRESEDTMRYARASSHVVPAPRGSTPPARACPRSGKNKREINIPKRFGDVEKKMEAAHLSPGVVSLLTWVAQSTASCWRSSDMSCYSKEKGSK